ncbi:MAG: mannosyltransferase family protein [Solirubrobacteraceae bacterium]
MVALARRVDSSVWQALVGSRLVLWLAGVFGFLQIGAVAGAVQTYDPTNLTAPFRSYFANVLLAPLARWDSVWYLNIARSGYGASLDRTAFFPLYPLLIHLTGWLFASDLLAGVAISLLAFAVALVLLQRLVALDFGAEIGSATVMLVAFSPMSFFFSAVYTEALFLALSVGCIYAARRERWWLAGVLGALAALSRNGGFALFVPLAVLYFYGPREGTGRSLTRWAKQQRRGLLRLMPRYRLEAQALWMLLTPAGLLAYLGYLWVQYGKPLAPFSEETAWYRHTTFPLLTIGTGAIQAFHGLQQLLQGPNPPYHVWLYAASPTASAADDILLFAFLLVGLFALLGAIYQQPAAYWTYALVLLVMGLSDPVKLQVLASLPRYELVIFPLFIWAAQLLTRHRLLSVTLSVSAVLLAVSTVEFATWHWVA